MTDDEKPKILVVDDKPANIVAIKKVLSSLDVEIMSATSGNEALSLFLRYDFSVILLDVQMPDMDGYETAKLMKEVDEKKYVPVIFLTANGRDEKFIFKGYDVGAVDYIVKPFEPKVLKSKVTVFINLFDQKKKLTVKQRELKATIKDKDKLLSKVDEQQQTINKHNRFKLLASFATLFFVAIFSFFYIKYISVKNAKLESYTEELTAMNEYINTLNTSYKRFIPYDILNYLKIEDITEVHLGDQVLEELIVLFLDVRGYSSISEHMKPEENIRFINEVLQIMQKPIIENGGIVNKYLGDGLMALFEKDPDVSLQASITILKDISDFSHTQVKSGHNPVRIGIGIDVGDMMVGTVGSEKRMEHTVIGDSVNVASRVEGMTKLYGATLLISDNFYQKLQNPSRYTIRLMDTVKVKGRNKPVTVYQVLDGENPETLERYTKTVEIFHEGVYLFRERRFIEAHTKFQQVFDLNPDDHAARIYMNRCKGLIDEPPEAEWSYVRTLKTK